MDPLIMFVFRIFWRFQKLIISTIYFPKRSWGLWACTFLGSRIVKYQLFSKILMLKRDFQWKELTPGRAASFKWSHISWKETSSSSVKQFPAPSKVKWICEMSNSFLLLDPFLCEGTLLIKGSTKTVCFQRFTSKRRGTTPGPKNILKSRCKSSVFSFFLGPVLNLFLSVDPRFQRGGGRLGGVVRIHSEACWGDVEEDVLRAFMTSAGSKTIFRRQTHGCTGCRECHWFFVWRICLTSCLTLCLSQIRGMPWEKIGKRRPGMAPCHSWARLPKQDHHWKKSWSGWTKRREVLPNR